MNEELKACDHDFWVNIPRSHSAKCSKCVVEWRSLEFLINYDALRQTITTQQDWMHKHDAVIADLRASLAAKDAESAERWETIKQYVATVENYEASLATAQAENGRLREALKFYAASSIYNFEFDYGATARRALKESHD